MVVSANEGSYEARRSALPDRVEVRVRSERRRRWSDGDKLSIVRETLAPGAVAQVVADRHGIGTGLLYTWRKQMLRAAMTGFAAVEIRPEALAAPQVADDRLARGHLASRLSELLSWNCKHTLAAKAA